MAPLTSAEKQRRYKERLKTDPEKYEEYKRKKREHYHAKKRLAKDLTPKEHYNAKIIWKMRQRNLRQKRKALNRIIDNTPPSSPLHMEQNIAQPLDMQVVQPIEPMVANQDCVGELINNNRQKEKKKKGRKNIRRDRTRMYKDNLRLKKENKNLKRLAEKYKKRYLRNKTKTQIQISPEPTDKVKYKKLTNAIKDKYQKLTKNTEKKVIKKMLKNIAGSGRKAIIKETLGITGPMRVVTKSLNSETELKKTIHNFFIRDDISRQTAGKKETVTRGNDKRQKRFLLDTMKNLYRVFKKEFAFKKCSYYYFTKHRPFFVVKPSVDGREMCLCKVHVNPAYKAQVLKRKRFIETDNLSILILSTVCDSEKHACMFGTCHECGDKKIELGQVENSEAETVKWFEWTRTEVVYEKNGKKFKAIKNVRQEKEDKVKKIMELFNADLKTLKKHVFNMKKQYKSFRDAVDNLKESEMVLVADFSENYNCKFHQEIQAHHFGGSRQQVSLHTVVVYLIDGESKPKVQSYCTISSSLCHQPAAIWAHLHPILKGIRHDHPEIKTIHFFSDGPFSQYRQKQNFYFSSTKTFEYGFTQMTWSFFEAGHGKGPADGIGGYLKRTADNIVATGKDICDAEQFYNALKNKSKIKLYLISPNDVDDLAQQLLPNITALKGTLHVHQLFTSVQGQLQYRNLSCFCERGFCQCLSPKIYHPIMSKNRNVGDSVIPNDNSSIIKDNSDDDDMPLSLLKEIEEPTTQDINIIDLCRPRNETLYDSIYEHEEEPSTSTRSQEDEDNRPVRCGDYLLVNVHATKGKIYKYVCKVDDLDDDGEIRVTFLRNVKKRQTFRLDSKDVSCIDYTDILKILKEPKLKIKPGQQYFEFDAPVDILEK